MDGGSADNAGAILCRPPWTAEVQIMQEQFSADHHGRRKCRMAGAFSAQATSTYSAKEVRHGRLLRMPETARLRKPKPKKAINKENPSPSSMTHLSTQARAPLAPTGIDNSAPTTSTHTLTKTVGSFAFHFTRLECTFHNINFETVKGCGI